MEFINQTLPSDAAAVLVGDFNTTAESGELDALLSTGKWVDSFRLKNPQAEGYTWDPRQNPNLPARFPHAKARAWLIPPDRR